MTRAVPPRFGLVTSSPTIENTIIAFNDGAAGVHCVGSDNAPVLSCTDTYGNDRPA